MHAQSNIQRNELWIFHIEIENHSILRDLDCMFWFCLEIDFKICQMTTLIWLTLLPVHKTTIVIEINWKNENDMEHLDTVAYTFHIQPIQWDNWI